MKLVSGEFKAWLHHLTAVWPGQVNFPFSALAEVIFAAALGGCKHYIWMRETFKGIYDAW